MPIKWALLIGVDFYFNGDKRPGIQFSHLRGCVHDVNRMRMYLRERIGVKDQNIKRLTASRKHNDPNDTKPEEDEDNLPTYENIKRELDRLYDQVQEDDHIYIHYSGHGILRKHLENLYGSEGDAVTGTALALTNVMTGGAYLTGYQLGVWIRRLVEVKKARVTLVLDSCFSGRGFRYDTFTARTCLDAEIDDSMLPSDHIAENEATENNHALFGNEYQTEGEPGGNRDPRVKRSWLSNPTGCTVLTGCQLNQKSGEYIFEGQYGRNGILTYWMLDILDKWSGQRRPTYARVAQHVKSRIKTGMMLSENQTPVLHGDSFLEFFGSAQIIQRPASIVHVLEQPGSDKSLYSIDIGTAQGVSRGAVYSIYPSLWSFARKQLSTSGISPTPAGENVLVLPKIRITKTRTFYSIAEAESFDTGSLTEPIATGSYAVLETWAFPSCPHFRLTVEGPEDERAEFLRDATDQLKSEIQGASELSRSSFNEGIDGTGHSFTVSANLHPTERAFEIRDANNIRVARIPEISIEDERRGSKIAHILSHLLRFKALKHLEKARLSDTFSTVDFEFDPLNKRKEILSKKAGQYEASHNQDLKIRFINKSQASNIHIAIFCFTASWGIMKVYPEDGQPTAQVPPNGCQPLLIDMYTWIPASASSKDPSDVSDLYRAYIYDGDDPPSWDDISLPKLPTLSSEITPGLPVEPVVIEQNDDPSRDPGKRSPTKVKNKHVRKGEWIVMDFKIHTSPNLQGDDIIDESDGNSTE